MKIMNKEKETLEGLTSEEVIELQSKYGKNEITTAKKESFFLKIVHILCEPMFLLLILAASIYFILGNPSDGIIMLVFVFAVITIDILQEWKTDKTLKALKRISTPYVTVLRDNNKVKISTTDLVPGDIVYIHEGIKIPADGKIIKCNGLKVDESILTGESINVYKTTKEDINSDYWKTNYCYQGTLVTGGTAIIRVDKIGNDTEYGKIGYSISKIKPKKTPLQIQIDNLVKTCSIIALFLFLLVAIFTFISLNDYQLKERIISSILSGITLAMAMIPEEFPVVLTVFLSMGAWRLAKKKSLIKKLPAVETLGAISVLCVDKTGTITKNQMEISEVSSANNPKELIKLSAMCSEEDTFDPMEKAIFEYAHNLGITKKEIFSNKKVKSYPFTDELKMMATVWKNNSANIDNKNNSNSNNDTITVIAKGSPESILKLCNLSSFESTKINQKLSEMQASGLRVIAIATNNYQENYFLPNDITKLSLKYLGLIGFIDPPKDNVSDYIAICKKAGIKVVMITGDNGLTASSIAKKVGINDDVIITGDMLEKMSAVELKDNITSCSIFSRVIPKHKETIVSAYQENGYIVAMTGDGVNDAAALKQADIGIAMGKKGSEVSSEAADLILLDDNFSTIVDTIKDGRRIYDNIKKSIGYILTIHIPIALSSLVASIIGIAPDNLMLLPLHVVLLELIIDPTCSVVLEREPEEPNIMNRPPRKIKEKLLDKSTIMKSIIQGIIIFLVSFITYYIYQEKDIYLARTLGLIIIILSNIFLVQVNASNQEYAYKNLSKFFKDKLLLIITSIIIVGIIFITYTDISKVLKLTSLSISNLTITIILSFISVYWYELVKLIKNYKIKKNIIKK